jgi:hypothetical protein
MISMSGVFYALVWIRNLGACLTRLLHPQTTPSRWTLGQFYPLRCSEVCAFFSFGTIFLVEANTSHLTLRVTLTGLLSHWNLLSTCSWDGHLKMQIQYFTLLTLVITSWPNIKLPSLIPTMWPSRCLSPLPSSYSSSPSPRTASSCCPTATLQLFLCLQSYLQDRQTDTHTQSHPLASSFILPVLSSF